MAENKSKNMEGAEGGSGTDVIECHGGNHVIAEDGGDSDVNKRASCVTETKESIELEVAPTTSISGGN
jgi:hypothetical protein